MIFRNVTPINHYPSPRQHDGIPSPPRGSPQCRRSGHRNSGRPAHRSSVLFPRILRRCSRRPGRVSRLLRVPRQENARPVDLPFLELPMDCRAGVELRRVVLRMGRTCRALGLQVVHPGFPIRKGTAQWYCPLSALTVSFGATCRPTGGRAGHCRAFLFAALSPEQMSLDSRFH
jgi:hypothetical protein